MSNDAYDALVEILRETRNQSWLTSLTEDHPIGPDGLCPTCARVSDSPPSNTTGCTLGAAAREATGPEAG